MRSLDASLVILYIATAPNMPQNVLLEEAIEQVIASTKFHLETNIYPEFDPVYRVECKGRHFEFYYLVEVRGGRKEEG